MLHVASPGFFAIISTLYARLLKIPLVLSYHTHLPIYARYPTTHHLNLKPTIFLFMDQSQTPHNLPNDSHTRCGHDEPPAPSTLISPS